MFKPVEWSFRANMYEVNVRQYTPEGSFKAFQEHIPRLKRMGINVLWFMPITPISLKMRQGTLGSYYACSDYRSINPEFGTLQDFKDTVQKAHDHDMKVIIDWVANHTGHDHHWTKTNPGYYKKNDKGEFYDTNGWQDVIDLNYYDQSMRAELLDAMQFWVEECGIDGFRCDMAHLIPLDFWTQARRHLDAIKPLFWLAESETVNYDLAFDCLYGWNWMHRTEAYAHKTESIGSLIQCLEGMHKNFKARHLFFTTNHDENSWNGTEYEKYAHLALPFAVLSCTWTGIPLLYSGQELPNKKRLKFFDKDLIEWKYPCELEEFYKTMLTLNETHPALYSHEPSTCYILPETPNGILAYTRISGEAKALIVLNLSDESKQVNIQSEKLTGMFKDVFHKEEKPLQGSYSGHLEKGGYRVLVN
ncbi:MAG: alpha-amylase family glycosyl hydrolase [Flavitalea sp.]